MPKPTTRAIRRKPQAVIIMMTEPDKIGTPVDHDFEWFETDKGRDEFFKQWTTHTTQDAKDYKDTVYLTAEVVDTANMKLGKVHVAPQTAPMKDWAAKVKKDPKVLLVEEAEKKAETTPRGKVKPRAKSSAAAVVKGGAKDKSETPTPKARPAAKKVAAKKAAAKKVSADVGTEGRAATLKARLDAKKTAAPVVDEVAALDAALALDEPSKARQE